MRIGRRGLVYAFVVLVIFGLALLWTSRDRDTDAPQYAYSQLLADAADDKVAAITQDGTRLTVTLSGESESRVAHVASEFINVYAEVCAAAGADVGQCAIEYTANEPSEAGSVITLLITALLPVLLIGTFIYFMMRQAAKAKPVS